MRLIGSYPTGIINFHKLLCLNPAGVLRKVLESIRIVHDLNRQCQSIPPEQKEYGCGI